jgi:hypothetical protein
MKITKRQLQRIIKEERAKLLRESFASTRHGSEQYLEALADLTYAADKALESLKLASRDIGPLPKALYDKLDEAMAGLEGLVGLANQAYDNVSEES